MFNEDEHQKPIHKLFYLITGTCNCGVRIRVPPPAPAGGFCQPCKPGGGAQKPNVLGMSMIQRQEYLQKQRAKPPAAVSPRTRARTTVRRDRRRRPRGRSSVATDRRRRREFDRSGHELCLYNVVF